GDQQDDPDRVDVDPRDVGLDRERQDGAQHHQKDANPDAHPSPSIRAACTTLYDPEPVTDVTTRSPAVEVPRPPAPRRGGRHALLRRRLAAGRAALSIRARPVRTEGERTPIDG